MAYKYDVVAGEYVMRLADYMVNFFEKIGTDVVFGHPGGPVLPLYNSLSYSSKIKHVLVRHEAAASFMADAYARITGKLGVCISTMGPGAANLLIGVATANSDSIPIMALTGQLPTNAIGRGWQQETDHVSLYKPVTKMSVRLINPSNAIEVIKRAYLIAMSGRRGAVHIDCPRDILDVELGNISLHVESLPHPPTVSDEVLKNIADLLMESRRPIILAGGGSIYSTASEGIYHLMDTLGIPVATSYNGRGIVPEDHPLALGRIGEYTPLFARELASEADLLLSIGYRFTDVSLDGWKINKNAKIIQVDIDPSEIGRSVKPTLGIIADAGNFINSLIFHIRSRNLAKHLAEKWSNWCSRCKISKENWLKSFWSKDWEKFSKIKPQHVVVSTRKIFPRDCVVAADAGKNKMWIASLFTLYEPRTWLHSGSYAPMGYSLCAAIGAKIAKPDKEVIAFIGDGGFQMVCQEIATAVENDAKVTVIVLDDGYLGSIRDNQLRHYERVFGTEFRKRVDIVKIAEGFGAYGIAVEKPSEVEEAIKEAKNTDKTDVVRVLIDGDERLDF